jgi:L-lactate dehydrogenase complex protein LldG
MYPADGPITQWEQMDTVVLDARFAVAENGALWIEEGDLPHRIVPFIGQYLMVRVASEHIVATMQDAYERLSGHVVGYGVFISGPSKTADIEQSLVYGAHGAVGMMVLVMEG